MANTVTQAAVLSGLATRLALATYAADAPPPKGAFLLVGGVAVPVRVGTWRETERARRGALGRAADATLSIGLAPGRRRWEGETPQLVPSRYDQVRAALDILGSRPITGRAFEGAELRGVVTVLGSASHLPGGRRSIRFRIEERLWIH